MFDCVSDVDVWPIDPDLAKHSIEQLSRRPAKRPPELVIVGIRLIGNKDRSSIGRPVAKDGLRRSAIKFTTATRLRRRAQARQISFHRQKLGRGVFHHSLLDHSALRSFNHWRKTNSWPVKILATQRNVPARRANGRPTRI
jgi:hypothetical protein